jgi:enoyl-CoA hydratase/carnithine racemase
LETKRIQTQVVDKIAWITLENPPLNEMDELMMAELADVHREFSGDPHVWGIVLKSNCPKFFSNGLPAQELAVADAVKARGIFFCLGEMIEAIYACEKPEIALINGHAMAGGAVLALLADFRFMGEGSGRYCFSEILVGLIIPTLLQTILKTVVAPARLEETIFGKAYKPQEAELVGLVNEVFESDQLEKEAEKTLKTLFRLPQENVRRTKSLLRREVLQQIKTQREEMLNELNDFFNDNLREGIRAVIEKRRPHFDAVK